MTIYIILSKKILFHFKIAIILKDEDLILLVIYLSIYIKSLNLNIFYFFNPSLLKICKILCIF